VLTRIFFKSTDNVAKAPAVCPSAGAFSLPQGGQAWHLNTRRGGNRGVSLPLNPDWIAKTS
jgi:hypothetical protein